MSHQHDFTHLCTAGDHGQLPPVSGGGRVYDWDKVKYTDARRYNYGTYKKGAPKWGERGLRAYESFYDNVFFLDTIMRVAASDVALTEEEYIFAWKHSERQSNEPRETRTLPTSADFAAFNQRQRAQQQTPEDQALISIHTELLTRFREMQLRARDGALDEADCEWMRLHMNEAERPEDFSSAGTSPRTLQPHSKLSRFFLSYLEQAPLDWSSHARGVTRSMGESCGIKSSRRRPMRFASRQDSRPALTRRCLIP